MTMKTLHGCTCLKDWVKIDGKKYSGCVYGQAGDPVCPMTTDKKTLSTHPRCGLAPAIPSCPVEKGCGDVGWWKRGEYDSLTSSEANPHKAKKAGVLKNSDSWDICESAEGGSFGHPKIPSAYYKMSRSANIKAIIGLILFLVFAGFIIPYLLYRFGRETFVHVWIPNLDLIATVFAFRGGLFDSTLFRFLYTGIPDTTFGFWSHLIIEYFALLGLTLITAQMVWKRNSISRGMSYALIMLLFSYFIPNALIEIIMEKIHMFLDKYRPFPKGGPGGTWGLPFIGGLLAVICFLLLEQFLINNYLYRIDKVSFFMVDKLWYSLGHKYIKKRKK